MSIKFKIIFSLLLQMFLVMTVPRTVARLNPAYFGTLHSWKDIEEHDLFTSKAQNKVVLLGTSLFGLNYCYRDDFQQFSSRDSVCSLVNIMGSQRKSYPKLQSFEFFDLTRSGRSGAFPFYVFLRLLATDNGSIKYILYDVPRAIKFVKRTDDLAGINQAIINEIRKLQPLYPYPQFQKLLAALEPYRDDSENNWSKLFTKEGIKEFIEARNEDRFWLRDLSLGVRNRLWPDRGSLYLETFLKEQREREVLANKAAFVPEPEFSEDDVLDTDDEFWGLEVMAKLCEARGIKLILYKPPIYNIPKQIDLYANHIYRPALAHLGPLGAVLLDYSDLKFEYPHDTPDGLHPSLTTNLVMSKRFLRDLEKLEDERERRKKIL